jgi:hypothetical protein
VLAAQLSGEQGEVTKQAFLDAFARWEAPPITGPARTQERGEIVADINVVELADLTMAAI